MVSTEAIALCVFGLVLVGIGYVCTLRVGTALAFQRRYAEALSSVPPSENPEHYEETREHRKTVFRIGGAVLLAVGVSLFAVGVYAALFVESFPS